MTAVRYRFGTTVCEIHTTQDHEGARATSYVVQGRTVALQPCEHVPPCEAATEDEARAMAVSRLEALFGPPTSKPGVLPERTGYRILDGRRTA